MAITIEQLNELERLEKAAREEVDSGSYSRWKHLEFIDALRNAAPELFAMAKSGLAPSSETARQREEIGEPLTVQPCADREEKPGLGQPGVQADQDGQLLHDAQQLKAQQIRSAREADSLYYIQNRGCCGNSARWWRVDGHGYTSDLNKAWRVPGAEAERICQSRRPKEDFPRLCSEMDAIAERHIDVQRIGGMNV